MTVTTLEIGAIVAEGATQMRGYDETLVEHYAVAMKNGAVFPPVTVFANGSRYYLADGFHRLGAAKAVKQKTIAAHIHEPIDTESAQRSAILFAVSANDAHGRNRTQEDKRRAVETLLKDPEWSKWTDREIGRQCRVSHTFVKGRRDKMINAGVLKDKPKRKAKRRGTEYEINTDKIGEKDPSPPKQKPTPEQKRVGADVRASMQRERTPASKPTWTHEDEHGYALLKSAWQKASLAAREKFRGEICA